MTRPTRSVQPRAREQGIVFMLALFVMTATVMLGLAFASQSTTQLEIGGLALDRGAAVSLAEGGVNHGISLILESASAVGTHGPYQVGEGSYTIEITKDGSLTYVLATAEANGQTASYLACAKVTDSALDVDDPLLIGGAVSSALSLLDFGGTLSHVGTLLSDVDSTISGVTEPITGFPSISIDTTDLATDADIVAAPDTTYNSTSLVGTVYGQGDVTLSTAVKVGGVLIVEGDLALTGPAGQFAIYGETTAIMVKGNLVIDDVTTLSVYGSIFVEGDVDVTDVDDFELHGSLIANGNVTLTNVNMTAEYDRQIVKDPPARINGGPRSGVYTEVWRLPFASAPGGKTVVEGANGR